MRQRLKDMSRRDLLKLFGVGFGATIAGQISTPLKMRAAQGPVTPLSTARNVIVIQNGGAPSPMEVFDFKETKWTAPDLDIQQINSDFVLSKTLFPQGYNTWAPRAGLVRSMRSGGLVHFPAQYYQQAGRALNSAIVREIPAFGCVVAKELESQRRDTDTFPGFISTDLWNIRCPPLGSGMLPSRFAGMDLNTNSVFDSFGGGNESEGSEQSDVVLEERWEALNRWTEVSGDGVNRFGPKSDEYKSSYDYGIGVLLDPRFKAALTLTEEDKERYGVNQDGGLTKLGLGMLLARNLLSADAGARFLWVANGYNGRNGGFDNHGGLYARGVPASRESIPIYDSVPRLDRALSALVEDLVALPGREPGKTMFDETLIVLSQEFGRTPEMNPNGGRDHWGDVFTNVLMGGGVQPGRVIGKTDEVGGKAIDMGWGFKEQPMMDHIVSTIYSALGIDYSKIIEDTPSGRVYEYQQMAPLGGPSFIPRTDIKELFV